MNFPPKYTSKSNPKQNYKDESTNNQVSSLAPRPSHALFFPSRDSRCVVRTGLDRGVRRDPSFGVIAALLAAFRVQPYPRTPHARSPGDQSASLISFPSPRRRVHKPLLCSPTQTSAVSPGSRRCFGWFAALWRWHERAYAKGWSAILVTGADGVRIFPLPLCPSLSKTAVNVKV